MKRKHRNKASRKYPKRRDKRGRFVKQRGARRKTKKRAKRRSRNGEVIRGVPWGSGGQRKLGGRGDVLRMQDWAAPGLGPAPAPAPAPEIQAASGVVLGAGSGTGRRLSPINRLMLKRAGLDPMHPPTGTTAEFYSMLAKKRGGTQAYRPEMTGAPARAPETFRGKDRYASPFSPERLGALVNRAKAAELADAMGLVQSGQDRWETTDLDPRMKVSVSLEELVELF